MVTNAGGAVCTASGRHPIHVYHGLDDQTVPSWHASLYGRAIPRSRVHCLPGRDHQLDNDLGEVATAILSLSPCWTVTRSSAVIRVAVEDRHRAVQLFGHDQPHQHVRQRERSQ